MPSLPYARRSRQESRRERWKKAVQRDRSLSPSARLFLVATLASKMSADGFVSHPRARLAALAGVTERQVGRYLKGAVEAHWLAPIARGVRGHTAEYQAQFPDEIGGHKDVPLLERDSRTYRVPLSGGHKCPAISEIAGHLDVPPLLPLGSNPRTRQLRNGHAGAHGHRDDGCNWKKRDTPPTTSPRRSAPGPSRLESLKFNSSSMTVTGSRATRSATVRPCLLAVMDGCSASRFEAMV